MNLVRSPTGRRILFTAYYFVEGAPIGFLWWSLPAILRANGLGAERIGALLGWLVLPWAFKWLWAPLIDLLQGPRWTLRAWIGTFQLGMGLTLLPLLFHDNLLRSDTLIVFLVAHAVLASSQDAAIDALMIRTTTPAERGQLAGWMQGGMLGARSLLGGGALLALSQVGGRAVVIALLSIVVFGLGLLALYRAPLPEREGPASDPPWRAFATHLRSALRRRTTWIGLAFAVIGGTGFEALGNFAGPLLTDRAGGSTDVAGRFFLIHAVVAMVVGGLVGGRLTDRLGARRGTLLAGALLGAILLAAAWVIALGEGHDAQRLVPWLTATYVAIGWFTAASYALFMDWTDPRLGATQFSAFMGATNLCESWTAAVAGRMIPRYGYGASFGVLATIGALSLLLLTLTRSRVVRRRRHRYQS